MGAVDRIEPGADALEPPNLGSERDNNVPSCPSPSVPLTPRKMGKVLAPDPLERRRLVR